mmetsp:Transcript_7731/g.16111  ORF Transcript_7731/g.16111 Transcript_7731/m.16111 type:complete len:315 (+) Transcript_7731:67-1011(+)
MPLIYIYAAAAALVVLPMGASCFQPQVFSVFGRALNSIEGWVAKRKVNADLDENCAKYTVGPDSEYKYAAKKPKVDHSSWDGVVKRYVRPGNVDDIITNVVDYSGIAKDEDVAKYERVMAEVNLAALEGTPNELLALYINAYNCLCIGHVTRYLRENNGELPTSVTQTTPPSQKGTEIWDVEAGVVGGETLSLNDIEHKILRSKWAEPRVHASIVCASASCPNLRTEAFVPDRLNEQMDDQARTWVTDDTKGVKVDDDDGQTFSRIFLWFEGDFKASEGPIAWAGKYLPSDTANRLNTDGEMKYFKYNWSLNKN